MSMKLNSPFLPELGGPGGLSVTDPLKRQNKMFTQLLQHSTETASQYSTSAKRVETVQICYL